MFLTLVTLLVLLVSILATPVSLESVEEVIIGFTVVEEDVVSIVLFVSVGFLVEVIKTAAMVDVSAATDSVKLRDIRASALILFVVVPATVGFSVEFTAPVVMADVVVSGTEDAVIVLFLAIKTGLLEIGEAVKRSTDVEAVTMVGTNRGRGGISAVV